MGAAGIDYGKDLAQDAAGNLYVAGYFSGTVDFDPGPQTTALASAGAVDVFLAKYDPSGRLHWAQRFGGSGLELPHSVQVDAAGNLYTAGYFTATATFGGTTLTSQGGRDVYVARHRPDGTVQWVTGFGGPEDDEAMDLAVDEAGRVYATGFFRGTLDADAGSGTTPLVSAGDADVWVAVFETDGRLLRAWRAGSAGQDYGHAVRVAPGGGIFVAGFFSGTADLDPRPSVAPVTSRGGWDVFVARHGEDGSLRWARSFGGPANDQVRPGGMATDASGNVYLGGDFTGATDFDPGAGTAILVSNGSGDVFAVKLSGDGGLGWATGMGGPGLDAAHRIAVDRSGDVSLAGWFVGSMTVAGRTLTAAGTAGASDALVARLDPDGRPRWALGVGGNASGPESFQIGGGLAVDAAGNAAVTGRFWGTGDFDPGSGTAILTSDGESDVFLLRLTPQGTLASVR